MSTNKQGDRYEDKKVHGLIVWLLNIIRQFLVLPAA